MTQEAKMGHTPGPWTPERVQDDAAPWEWHPTGSGDGYVVMKGQRYIAETYTMRHADLIAAAPAMLGELECLLDYLEATALTKEDEERIAAVAATIAHARGEK